MAQPRPTVKYLPVPINTSLSQALAVSQGVGQRGYYVMFQTGAVPPTIFTYAHRSSRRAARRLGEQCFNNLGIVAWVVWFSAPENKWYYEYTIKVPT